jgi:glucose dehydrogenase
MVNGASTDAPADSRYVERSLGKRSQKFGFGLGQVYPGGPILGTQHYHLTVVIGSDVRPRRGGTIGDGGRVVGSLIALDPGTGEIKRHVETPYSNSAGVLSTEGGIVITALIDGTVLAYDDQTLDELWRINVGSGFNAPYDL